MGKATEKNIKNNDNNGKIEKHKEDITENNKTTKTTKTIKVKLKTVIILLCLPILIYIGMVVYFKYWPKKVILYDKEFKDNIVIIDLSDTDIDDINELIEKLQCFKKVRTVKFGSNLLINTDKEKLKNKYPNIDFIADVYYCIYEKNVTSGTSSIDLSDVKIKNVEELILELSPLINLTEVNLYNQTFTKDEQLKLQEKYPGILFKWTVNVLSENVDYNIEELDLSKKKINDLEDFKKTLKLLPYLKKLNMSNTNLSNEQLGALREEFPNIRIDWIVYLGKWSVKTDAIAFSVLVAHFDYKRMTSSDIEVLKYCTELQALDIGHQSITDISVIGEYLPNLRVLILADNKITDISPLSNLKHLHFLELFMNNITDLTPLSSCTELVDLNICFNYRLSNIQPILNLPMLERLWLIADNISSADYNLIRNTYPNVKLVTTGSGSTGSGWRTHKRYFAMIDMYYNNYISEEFTKYDR